MPSPKLSRFQAFWVRIWMSSVLVGLFLFVLGINPNLINMDRSPVVGFVQVGVWLFGLALMCFGGYATLRIYRNKHPLSLRAEIGERLIATGYVVAAAASLADFIGIGSHEIPELIFGPLQIIGLIVGVVTALLGIILYWPRFRHEEVGSSESVQFTPPEGEGEGEEKEGG
jgi:hypothetical protein